MVLTFSKQGNVFPTVNRQFGGFGVNNISDDSKMKLKLSFELSLGHLQLLSKNQLFTSKHIVVIKRDYFHVLYIYLTISREIQFAT